MREHATLKLIDGREVPVELDLDDLDQREILVSRTDEAASKKKSLVQIIDEHLATATPHPAGTTDRLLEADRSRPY